VFNKGSEEKDMYKALKAMSESWDAIHLDLPPEGERERHKA